MTTRPRTDGPDSRQRGIEGPQILAMAVMLGLACGATTGTPGSSDDDPAPSPTLEVSPSSGAPESEVLLEGRHLPPRERVGIGAGPPASEYEVFDHSTTDDRGALEVSARVPSWAEPGDSVVFALDLPGESGSVLAEPFRVVTKAEEEEEPPSDEIAVTGALTDEGVECPALRGDDDRLYTLTGADLGELQAGDRVRVRGSVARFSYCMQGTTIEVREIERRRDE